MSKSLRPERARSFAHKYVENGFNASQAVVDLGITDNRPSAGVIGHRLLNNVKVKTIVEDHIKRHKMSADEVAEELSEVAQTKTPIDATQKLKALELLTKVHGLITNKSEITHSQSKQDQLQNARQSYILAALPELQLNNPDWPISKLQDVAEQKFNDWLAGLQVTPLASNMEQ